MPGQILRLQILTAVLVMLAACGAVSESPGGGESTEFERAVAVDLATARLVDLSHAYDDSTLYWPTSPSAFELEKLAWGPSGAGFFYSANRFRTPEHGGTHLDAPIHFAEGRWTVGQIPLERLIARVAVIDVRAQAAEDADYRLEQADIESWEERYGELPEGSIVLMRTGWDEFWPDALTYLGSDAPGDASDLHFPGFGETAVRYLVEEREISMLGVDTASIDHGPSQNFIAHQVANGANIPALENLTNLDQLPEWGAWLIALPVKISEGSGAPARVIAVLPDS
jgi:kynurenine formamidase